MSETLNQTAFMHACNEYTGRNIGGGAGNDHIAWMTAAIKAYLYHSRSEISSSALMGRLKTLKKSTSDSDFNAMQSNLQAWNNAIDECIRLSQSSEISETVTVRSIIDDRPWVAGEGVKFKLRYLEYENAELGCSTGTIDLHDVIVSSPVWEQDEISVVDKWELFHKFLLACKGAQFPADIYEIAFETFQPYLQSPVRELSGWNSMKINPPRDGEECLIWLKPINGNGRPSWSIRKGRFWCGMFSEWGEIVNYKPDTYSRITHWHSYMEMPPINEIESVEVAKSEGFRKGKAYPCGCHKCTEAIQEEKPETVLFRKMILCSKCGNKRCPHATDHELVCSGSNDPGQEGSVYE